MNVRPHSIVRTILSVFTPAFRWLYYIVNCGAIYPAYDKLALKNPPVPERPPDIDRSMHILPLVDAIVLLSVANGSPLIAKLICASTCTWPLDGNVRFVDGRPLFGASKTIRGVVASVLATTFGARLLAVGTAVGLQISIAAMAGDLLSSFIKRRLGLPPSSQAIGLDQIPESLFPLLACRSALSLSGADIAAGCILFIGGQLLLSRVFYRLGLRDRPY